MTLEVLSHIYEPFFSTKPVGSGTGLGIPTTLSIVRAHGGFMMIYSDVGKGSVFRLYFPADADADAVGSEPQARTIDLPRGDGDMLLVVEDDSSVRTTMAATLEAFGYRVLLAQDGAEAIERFRKAHSSIALVITDLTMPVLDGPQALRAMRQLDPRVPCVVMSGQSDVDTRHLPQDISVSARLPKPFTAATLLQTVSKSKRRTT